MLDLAISAFYSAVKLRVTCGERKARLQGSLQLRRQRLCGWASSRDMRAEGEQMGLRLIWEGRERRKGGKMEEQNTGGQNKGGRKQRKRYKEAKMKFYFQMSFMQGKHFRIPELLAALASAPDCHLG